ncbi:GLPGLI family protein [Chitinophaga japonensis]|uniref:GLPGLI family protein n=1 Tax=Chitinophaga japonensis TaxID=104662 RepID=A0A562SJ97_CHIJA|nr:GLPGLI family protein [Chitinophaga japonensis]TWI80906.1 GLPGLI family protein [Chitinophaga japonensis]
MQRLFTYLLLCFAVNAAAQNPVYLTHGRIEFEKRLNMYARLDAIYSDESSSWKELEKKRTPQFKVTYFDLLFHHNKTLYRPGRENPDNIRLRPDPAEDNVIYSELDKQESVSQKKVFEEIFLVKDSTRSIHWKITDEKRNIAGFDCRRANAIIMDSIYVVAFYADAIVTPGGPESFSGLPGMILGVALPHEHVTWFATKVLTESTQETALQAPKKGTKVNNKELLETLNRSLKDWGRYGNTYIKVMML